MRQPAGVGLLGPRQDAIPALESRHLLVFAHAQARGLARRVGRPVVRLGDRFSVLDVDDLENRDFRQTAHAMVGRPSPVDQALFGHVLQPLLQSDLFLPLEAERLADLPLARGSVSGLNEFEYLPLGRQALCLPVVLFRFLHARNMGPLAERYNGKTGYGLAAPHRVADDDCPEVSVSRPGPAGCVRSQERR